MTTTVIILSLYKNFNRYLCKYIFKLLNLIKDSKIAEQRDNDYSNREERKNKHAAKSRNSRQKSRSPPRDSQTYRNKEKPQRNSN